MRKFKAAKLVMVFALLIGHFAHAEIWQTASTLPFAKVSAGGFGKLYFEPSDFNVFGNATYGFSPTLQGEFRVGLGSAKSYVGGFMKNFLAHGEVGDVAIWGGVHHQGNTMIDVAPIFSHSFGAVNPYVAPLFMVWLSGHETFGAALVPGLEIPMQYQLKLYTEITLNVANYYSAVSSGVRYFF